MTGGDEWGTEDGPDERALQSGRGWQHPSEVGLATRGRADRRRTTMIASGVLIGGLGVLLSGLVIGNLGGPATATASTIPVQRAERSVALVMSYEGDDATSSSGLVLDDQGHLLVDSDTVTGADRIWAKCADGEMQPAEVVGSDDSTGLVVLRIDRPRGDPVSVAELPPSSGEELRVVSSRHGGADPTMALDVDAPAPSASGRLINLTEVAPARHFSATVRHSAVEPAITRRPPGGLRGAIVFDRAGRLAGIVTEDPGVTGTGVDRVQMITASDAVDAADGIVADRR